ncbi:MAG: PDZ domain-containing protein [Planctomycetota bacterium]
MHRYAPSLLALIVGVGFAQDPAPPPPPPPPPGDVEAPAPPAPPSEEALELYRQASLKLHEERFAEARELWDALATGFPDQALSGEARYWRARCLEHLGQFDRARHAYRAIVAEPHNTWIQDAKEGLARLDHGPGVYRVVRLDGTPLSGRLHGLDPEVVQVWVQGQPTPERVRWTELKEVTPVAEPGVTRVILASGDCLTGTIVRATPATVELRTSPLGTVELPHAVVLGIDAGAAYLTVLDGEVGAALAFDGGEEQVEELVTPDGKRVVITKRKGGARVDVDVDVDARGQGDVQVIETKDGKRIVVEEHAETTRAKAGEDEGVEEFVTPDGKHVVITKRAQPGGEGGDVQVIETKDGKRIVIETHVETARAKAGESEGVEEFVTPDGKRVVIRKRIEGAPHEHRWIEGGADEEREDVIVTPDGKRVVIKERVRDGQRTAEVLVLGGGEHERPGVVFVPGDDDQDHVMVLRQGDGERARRLVLRQAHDGEKPAKVRAIMVMGDDEEQAEGEQRFEFEFDGVDLERLHEHDALRDLPKQLREHLHRALKESGRKVDPARVEEALRDMERALRDLPEVERAPQLDRTKRIYEFRGKPSTLTLRARAFGTAPHPPHAGGDVWFGRTSPGGNVFFGATSRGDKDRVFLENGDVLSGEVRSVDGESVRLEASFGSCTIKRSQVARIEFKQRASSAKVAPAAPAVPRVRTVAPRAPAAPSAPQGFLGIRYEAADGGIRITGVIEGSTAAGLLMEGDVLQRANGRRLGSGDDLREVLGGLKPGDSISLEGTRSGGTFQIQTQLKARPTGKDKDSSFTPSGSRSF